MEDLPQLLYFGASHEELIRGVFEDLVASGLFNALDTNCFVIAGLLAEILRGRGVAASVMPCVATVTRGDNRFGIGYPGLVARPGQVDGHVVCLAENRLLIDFGLSKVRRCFWKDCYSAAVCQTSPERPLPAGVPLGADSSIVWSDHHRHHRIDAVMAEHRPHIDAAYELYLGFTQSGRTAAASDFPQLVRELSLLIRPPLDSAA